MMLTAAALSYLAFAVGAHWRRILGGWLSVQRAVVVTAGAVAAVGLAMAAGASVYTALLFAGALMWAPGHGSYHDVGTMPPFDDEWLRPILSRLVPARWFGTERYDVAGMALLYTIMAAAVLPALLLHGVGWWALAYLATGPAVAAFYLAASRIALPAWGPLQGFTTAGELFSGGIRWGYGIALLTTA